MILELIMIWILELITITILELILMKLDSNGLIQIVFHSKVK